MPLDSQNGTTLLAGRSVLAGRARAGIENNMPTVGKAGKAGMVTPMEPRTARAPLGNKTTNAKAQTVQQQRQLLQKKQQQGLAVKDRIKEIESQSPQQATQPTTARRSRVLSPRVNGFKLSVLSDETANKAAPGSGDDEDREYAPPPVAARPYESDIFPDGVLTFAAFRPENRLRGYYDHYYNPVDASGVSRRDRELADKQCRAFAKLDQRVKQDLDTLDWSISDVPASKGLVPRRKQTASTAGLTASAAPAAIRAPPTVAARSAAAALAHGPTRSTAAHARAAKPAADRPAAKGVLSKVAAPKFLSGLPLRKEKPAPLAHRPKSVAGMASETVSRTTLGYNKGRSALSLVKGRTAPAVTRSRSVTAAASKSARAATQSHEGAETEVAEVAEVTIRAVEDEEKTPAFVSIFDVDEEALGGAGTFVNDDVDDDFQLRIVF